MSNDATANGGGYGNPGEAVQSAQQARAQQYDSPSANMAEDFAADGQVESQPSQVMDEAVDGTGMGLHNQSEAFRSQTQIAYQDGTGVDADGYSEEE